MDREELKARLIYLSSPTTDNCNWRRVQAEILAEFERLNKELTESRMTEGYQQQTIDEYKRELDRLINETYEPLKRMGELEDKAEVLDRICEFHDRDCFSEDELRRYAERLKDATYFAASEVMNRICDYLDSQEKPCSHPRKMVSAGGPKVEWHCPTCHEHGFYQEKPKTYQQAVAEEEAHVFRCHHCDKELNTIQEIRAHWRENHAAEDRLREILDAQYEDGLCEEKKLIADILKEFQLRDD